MRRPVSGVRPARPLLTYDDHPARRVASKRTGHAACKRLAHRAVSSAPDDKQRSSTSRVGEDGNDVVRLEAHREALGAVLFPHDGPQGGGGAVRWWPPPGVEHVHECEAQI